MQADDNAKKQFHAVSLSGGKDSTAMLLMMLERDMPIDAVLTADTGMEFPEMYEHLERIDQLLYWERGILGCHENPLRPIESLPLPLNLELRNNHFKLIA